MGPPSYMRSVVDRNVVMRRVPVYFYLVFLFPFIYVLLTERRHRCDLHTMCDSALNPQMSLRI